MSLQFSYLYQGGCNSQRNATPHVTALTISNPDQAKPVIAPTLAPRPIHRYEQHIGSSPLPSAHGEAPVNVPVRPSRRIRTFGNEDTRSAP